MSGESSARALADELADVGAHVHALAGLARGPLQDHIGKTPEQFLRAAANPDLARLHVVHARELVAAHIGLQVLNGTPAQWGIDPESGQPTPIEENV